MRIKKFYAVAIVLMWVCSISGCQSKDGNAKQNDWAELKSIDPTDQLTDYPALNIVTDNPVLGDEHDFVRIAPWDEENRTNIADFQTDDVVIEAGKSYSVMVYYHNAAAAELAEDGAVQYAVLALAYPETLQKGTEDYMTATFAYGEDTPQSMRLDSIRITATDNVRLQPGVILAGAEPEYCAMECDNYGENWTTSNPAVITKEGVCSQMFYFNPIMPGYDGAGFIFLKLDAVTAE